MDGAEQECSGYLFVPLIRNDPGATEDHAATFDGFPSEAPPETDCIIVVIGIP